MTRLQWKHKAKKFIEKNHWMKELQAPKVVAIKMQFGKLKLIP